MNTLGNIWSLSLRSDESPDMKFMNTCNSFHGAQQPFFQINNIYVRRYGVEEDKCGVTEKRPSWETNDDDNYQTEERVQIIP